MQEISINVPEMLDAMQNVMDTIWIIIPSEDRVKILRDTMTPEQENTESAYSRLCRKYYQDFIYPPDYDRWESVLSLSALEKFCASGKMYRDFDMRFRNAQFGFEWHDAHLAVLRSGGEVPDRVLLTSRFVNAERRAAIVEQAVKTEYDYVVYIEADQNSYVMYASNDKTDTPLPPVISNNYEMEVAKFHHQYVPEEERESLTKKLRIAHVGPRLKDAGEYIVYCTVIENGVRRDKKLRFTYFDQTENIWILTRTDITQIWDERRKAESANRAKSDFLSRMSHDIRTPMNAIIGMSAIARSHLDNRERVKDCLQKIDASSKLLLSLINEVLDMSKIESGRIALVEEELCLADLVQSVVTMVQPQIEEKNQCFRVHINKVSHEFVIGDPQRLQQLVLNLLSNAVKYTPEEGNILLEISEKPAGASDMACYEFVVADNGIGMKTEFLEKALEPFERAEDSRISAVQGTGLGLSICQSAVEMMGGQIQVESEYGKGSRFTATVYLHILKKQLEEQSLRGRSVLLADDDEVLCRNTSQRLEELGMKVRWVLSGREAVAETIAAHEAGDDYFAVILDLKMPEMDGIEATRQIRKTVGGEVPIIMVSAYNLSEYMDAALLAGADSFITKPLFQSRLVCKFKQILYGEDTAVEKPIKSSSLFTGKRVLLAEDNELNCEIAVEILSSTGISVETALNGKAALEKIANSPEAYYDLIFMDIQMPVMDGCTAASLIRGLDRKDAKAIPIIAMTANAFADDRKKTAEAGMNGHLAKPIDMPLLMEVLRKWLK